MGESKNKLGEEMEETRVSKDKVMPDYLVEAEDILWQAIHEWVDACICEGRGGTRRVDAKPTVLNAAIEYGHACIDVGVDSWES
jgi:hypothetical protein